MNCFDYDETTLSDGERKTDDKKKYSIIPDLLTGWKPKNIKIPAPIIITYKSQLITQILNYYDE
jgi:hypothetical protein